MNTLRAHRRTAEPVAPPPTDRAADQTLAEHPCGRRIRTPLAAAVHRTQNWRRGPRASREDTPFEPAHGPPPAPLPGVHECARRVSPILTVRWLNRIRTGAGAPRCAQRDRSSRARTCREPRRPNYLPTYVSSEFQRWRFGRLRRYSEPQAWPTQTLSTGPVATSLPVFVRHTHRTHWSESTCSSARSSPRAPPSSRPSSSA